MSINSQLVEYNFYCGQHEHLGSIHRCINQCQDCALEQKKEEENDNPEKSNLYEGDNNRE